MSVIVQQRIYNIFPIVSYMPKSLKQEDKIIETQNDEKTTQNDEQVNDEKIKAIDAIEEDSIIESHTESESEEATEEDEISEREPNVIDFHISRKKPFGSYCMLIKKREKETPKVDTIRLSSLNRSIDKTCIVAHALADLWLSEYEIVDHIYIEQNTIQ